MLSLGWALARWTRSRPRSLLDNTPLRNLLSKYLDMSRIEAMLAGGICTRWHLRAPATPRASTSPSIKRTRPSSPGCASSAWPCARS